jgi:excisionase family DNA binding protein
MNHLLTVKDLSEIVGLHPQSVYRLIKRHEIPFLKRKGVGLRFKKDEIEHWLDQGSSKINPLLEHLSQIDLSLGAYDRLFLKGEVKVSPKGKTWNYPFGSVYLRQSKSGKNRWYVYFRIEGKRVREAVKLAQTRADAVKVLTSKVAEAFRGKHGFKKPEKSEEVFFEGFGKEFLELYSRVHWRAKTIRGHENSLRHLNRFFKGKRLSDVTPELTARYSAERKTRVSAATVNRELSCLKCVLNRAVEWGRLETNPIVRVKKFKEPEPKDRILAGEELRRLIEASAPHLLPIVLTALCTAMRRSEILSLKWDQVDLGKKMVRVEKTKSGKPRVIPINSVLLDEFSRLKRANGKSEYVFLDPAKRRPMKDIKTAFKSACARAKKNPDDEKDPGIVGLRFHDLRHNAASKMVEAGIDLVTVSKILGHSSIQTTMRYAHPTPENMRRAVETLAQNVTLALDFVPILSTKKEGVLPNAFVSVN